jgi:hypothetical protein
MNITVDDIKKVLDSDEFIQNEIQKYCKEKEKEQELALLKHMLKEKFDDVLIDKYLCLVHDLEVNNSNFRYYGCSHEVSFRLANMKVSYEFDMHSPNRGGDSITLSVDDNQIMFLDYNEGIFLGEIFYDEFSTHMSSEDFKKFNKISKTHFPDENPETIFNIILSILSYYYDR